MEAYINDKCQLYTKILEFIESEDGDSDENLLNLRFKDGKEMQEFLHTISIISDNHHRNQNFIRKIEQILQHIKNQIKQTLSNIEIFYIFENNKIIILFLLKNEIITITNTIYQNIISKPELNGNRYCHFFYPELEKFIGEKSLKSIKDDLLLKDNNIFDNFDKKREEGENDSYICSLIRQDSVKEFISYVNRTNYPLSSQIAPSIFETNSFLIENSNTTLIEYAAFFGSIQIFQYLIMNNVELKPSLWLYSIHSKSAEMIHIFESNKVLPPVPDDFEKNELHQLLENELGLELQNDNFIKCFYESIKCHHNDFAEYIENNLLDQSAISSKQKEIFSNYLKYHNYSYFQKIKIINEIDFFDFCFYNYDNIADLLLKQKEKDIGSKTICKQFFLIKFQII